MSPLKTGFATATLALALVATAPLAEARTCVKKAGQGTGATEESARFQAWEAVLQATDWGMWSSWITGAAKVGTAPGYKVSGVRFKCTSGGLGKSCIGQGTLCK